MKIRRLSAAVAVAASGALLFSACTSPAGSDDPAEGDSTATSAAADGPCKADLGDVATADGEIKVSVEDEFLGYNSNTPETYSTYNSAVTDRLFSNFWYFGDDGSICTDESYGTYEAVSEDPLQVEYTLNDEAVWSDGTPVTYADYVLDWAAQAITEDGKVTEDGTETPLFNHISGLTLGDYVPEGPQADSPDAKTFTYDYETVYADWKIQISSPFPAHVVAEQAGVSTEELVAAIQDLDMGVLKKAAEFWNEGWLSQPGQVPDPALTPVTGPYNFKADGWQAGQYITLEANEQYWGTPAATKELTFRFVAADAQIQALANGDLDAINPNGPTVDTVQQLEQLGDAVTVESSPTLTWEHLDFNFGSGIFSDSLEAREAFALCVPRQKIVDDLIQPIDPEAVVMNAREVFPFQENYEDVVSQSYDGRYDEVDLDAAKEKFEAAGLEEGTKVRIGYAAPNPRRAAEVEAIKSSCDQVGFDVEDSAAEDFFDKDLPNGDYEVALFAWAGSGQIASGQNIYATDQPQNYGKYSDETVDEAWKTLAGTTDEAVHAEQVVVIEKQLWDTLFGIPLFAHPGVIASSSSVENVRPTAAQSGIVWNAEQWARAS
ncbi:ABC transporter family substrate-binding protein [Promicromonospora thailandica]|uniref:Peptide/nickel transport system substrate-binding protein n=1 Tax=Promicromonospora thailandica TaxID=765201 RepID=A0A9X2JUH5_9MICO|nr:ABC transporter family substrate-binding protein [Promicromonospora thailandica]MCP2263028.1 peptide/nickel transport system substrate-binding protein [Promicromonospora thailandica]BFF18397.1 ABC transporter family substrate-binding protein [Promicromonospora thailandica]